MVDHEDLPLTAEQRAFIKGVLTTYHIIERRRRLTEGITINLGPVTYVNSVEPTSQERYRNLYVLLAWGSGVAFLIALLVISLVWPNPTPNQLRVQAGILALAAAGFTTVMSGIMNLTTRLGKQLSIGATGAFAVLVLYYLFNPAVLR